MLLFFQKSIKQKTASFLVLSFFLFGQFSLPALVLAQGSAADVYSNITTGVSSPSNTGTSNTRSPSQAYQYITTGQDTTYNASSPSNQGGGSGGGQDYSALAGAAGGAATSVGACLGGGSLGAISNNAAKSAKEVPTSDSKVRESTKAVEVKTCMLDGMAFQLKEALVKGIIKGVVNYINEGFEGGPGYMQDEDSLFLDVSEQNFNEFINDPRNFSSQCSAWAPDVRLALAVSYGTSVGGTRVTQISGTGTGTAQPLATGEPEACVLDHDGYGAGSSAQDNDFWSDFLSQTTTTGGNPLTTFLSSQDRLAEQLEYEAQKKKDEIDRGRGYFDNVTCSGGASSYSSSPGSFSIGGKTCLVNTVGSSIAAGTDHVIGSDMRRLELSDEFDEIFGQLIAMLMQMILGKNGLAGVSEKSGGSRSFIDAYASEVNTDALVQSRDDLLTLTTAYRENAAAYKQYKQDSIDDLISARNSVLETYNCYNSKYDTWIYESNGYLIPANEVEDVPESQRKRATFYKTAVIGIIDGEQVLSAIYLTPSQTGEKVERYEALLGELDGYIRSLQAEIGQVEEDIAQVAIYEHEIGSPDTDQEWLASTISSSTILAKLNSEFANNTNTVTINSGNQIPSELNVDYSSSDARTVIQKFNNNLEIRLKDVGLTEIVMTLRGDLMDFPDGVNQMPLSINWGFNNTIDLTERPVVVTRGIISDISFSNLARNSSYSFSFTVDDEDFESFDGSVFTIGTNTTDTYNVPQNLTIEQIIQTYTVVMEEMTIYDTGLAYDQYEQIRTANEALLLGNLQANGSRGLGVDSDLESCREFNNVVQPNSEINTGTNGQNNNQGTFR